MSAINPPHPSENKNPQNFPSCTVHKNKKSEKPTNKKKYTRGCLAESPRENRKLNPTPMKKKKKKLDVSLRPWDHASDAESRLLK